MDFVIPSVVETIALIALNQRGSRQNDLLSDPSALGSLGLQ